MPGGITFSDSTDQGGVKYFLTKRLNVVLKNELQSLCKTCCSLENEIKSRNRETNVTKNTRRKHSG